jgi:hypothetical protein
MIPWTELPFGSRAVGTLLAAAYGFPIFFAGIIFTESFRRCQDKSVSFGSNLFDRMNFQPAFWSFAILGLFIWMLLASKAAAGARTKAAKLRRARTSQGTEQREP